MGRSWIVNFPGRRRCGGSDLDCEFPGPTGVLGTGFGLCGAHFSLGFQLWRTFLFSAHIFHQDLCCGAHFTFAFGS